MEKLGDLIHDLIVAVHKYEEAVTADAEEMYSQAEMYSEIIDELIRIINDFKFEENK